MHHRIRSCRLIGHNPLFIILSTNILSKAATEDLQSDQFLDPAETTQMNILVLYGVQRILSVLAWFTHQKCFHVKYNVSNLFSMYHLPHTNFCIMKRNFVYSVCILRPMVLIILEGNMSLPVKSGFIQEWTKWGSSSPSWTDHRNWFKKTGPSGYVMWLQSTVTLYDWSWSKFVIFAGHDFETPLLCKISHWCLWQMF
jgi:hypothetical protein